MIPVITVSELLEKVKTKETFTILDVREPWELEIKRIDDSRLKNISLGYLTDRVDELNRSEPVYAICETGGRSLEATEILLEKGFEIKSVKGGMFAWEELEVETKK